jgi:cyanophycinase
MRSYQIKAKVLCIVIILFAVAELPVQESRGPQKGTLVLTGGDFGKGVIERFVSLAGGPDADFIYIPTAASSIKLPSGFIYDPSDSDTPAANTREFELELCKFFGVKNVTVLHTRNHQTADSGSFAGSLRKANAVWLSSGNAGRLADAYLDTQTQKEIQAVLDRGGVVGGNSAGAIIQGSYIVRGRSDKPILMAKGHEHGFGFLKNVAVNPHLTEQKRENELVNVLDVYPKLLGIGLDEKAAIIVRGDGFEVIGENRVAVYDNQKHGNNWYYWLKQGDKFDLKKRSILNPSIKRRSLPVIFFASRTGAWTFPF